MAHDLVADRILARADDFVRDITELVRAAAFEALDIALKDAEDVAPTRARQPRSPALPTVEMVPIAAPIAKRLRSTTAPVSEPEPVPSSPASYHRIAPSSMPRTRPDLDAAEPEVDATQLADAILVHLAGHPDLRAEELAQVLGADAGHVKRALAGLMAERWVSTSGNMRT